MSHLVINDTPNLRGEFTLQVITNGSVNTVVDDPNMIVYSGRAAIGKGLLSNDHPYITGVMFGNKQAASISPTDTVLDTQFTQLVAGTDYTVSIIDGSAARPPRIQYVITIPEVSALNAEVREFNAAALMMSNGAAFAMKKFGTIRKTSAMGIVITWSIYV